MSSNRGIEKLNTREGPSWVGFLKSYCGSYVLKFGLFPFLCLWNRADLRIKKEKMYMMEQGEKSNKIYFITSFGGNDVVTGY